MRTEYGHGDCVEFTATVEKLTHAAGKPAQVVLEIAPEYVSRVDKMIGARVDVTFETKQTVVVIHESGPAPGQTFIADFAGEAGDGVLEPVDEFANASVEVPDVPEGVDPVTGECAPESPDEPIVAESEAGEPAEAESEVVPFEPQPGDEEDDDALDLEVDMQVESLEAIALPPALAGFAAMVPSTDITDRWIDEAFEGGAGLVHKSVGGVHYEFVKAETVKQLQLTVRNSPAEEFTVAIAHRIFHMVPADSIGKTRSKPQFNVSLAVLKKALQ